MHLVRLWLDREAVEFQPMQEHGCCTGHQAVHCYAKAGGPRPAHTTSRCTVVPIWKRSSSTPAGAAAAAPGAAPAPPAAAPGAPQAPAEGAAAAAPGAALLLAEPRAPSSAISATAARLAAYARSTDEGASGPSS